MARAISVAWAKQHMVSKEEWQGIVKDQNKSLVELALDHHQVPRHLYVHLLMKNRKEQGQLATLLCQQAGVSTDRPATIHEIKYFEDLLDIQICVMSA